MLLGREVDQEPRDHLDGLVHRLPRALGDELRQKFGIRARSGRHVSRLEHEVQEDHAGACLPLSVTGDKQLLNNGIKTLGNVTEV